MQQFFDYSEEVAQALRDKKPLLALESTLITHGLPFPQNIEVAKTAEQLAREEQVTPATIAIIHGKVKIGLSLNELEMLVQDKSAIKASTRDIPYVLSQGMSAGTTVAATLFCADYAGIKIFATGGIGGVHRGDSGDISADLIELARTPIGVVCSGVKAILDIPRTLEYLETFSVPIVGYRTDTLPAFYTATSPYKLKIRADNIPALSKLLKIHWQLGLSSSVLIVNPVPAEYEIPMSVMEPAINQALVHADERQITGKDITPFLLNDIFKTTHGRSLQANIQLIKNNVKLAAMLARTLTQT